jgi:hypothetical protein
MLSGFLTQYRAMLWVLALALAFACGWKAQGWRLDAQLSTQAAQHAQAVSDLNQAALTAATAQQTARVTLEQQLAALDQQHYQELTHAQTVIDAVSGELASGQRRLSVRLAAARCPGVPAATGAAGLDDAAERADLHPATAASVVAIAGEADQCAIKLVALQKWVKQVMR